MKRLHVLGLILGIALGVAVSLATSADASRDSSGTYTRPAGQPVTAGTTITAATFNTLTADIATELTSSLDRSGRGAMLAPLQLSSGTVSAPSLTFSADTDTGIYRGGANDVRVSAGGTSVLQCSATTVTFPLGITATQATANTAAIVATGAGTGTGVTGTGGGTNAAGVYGVGGATNGGGVQGQGTGTGPGGSFTGGANNAKGVDAFGVGSGVGISATGGATGVGVSGTGGGTAAGGTFANGTAATGGTRQSAVTLTNGDLTFSGVTNPTSTTAASNRLTPMSFAKAWGYLTDDGVGSVSVTAGHNITSVAFGGAGTDYIIVTFAAAFSSANYACVAQMGGGSVFAGMLPTSTTTATIAAYNASTPAAYPLDTNPAQISFVCYGAQ